MKYDVDGRLYLYVERDKFGKVASLIKLSGSDKLLRYDGTTKEKTFTKYDCECILVQKFQESESWVTVIKKGCDITDQYEFPKRKSSFSFDKHNSVILFTISSQLTSKYISVLGVSNSNQKRYPHIRISPGLSNSGLFINDKIAKNARKLINITDSD